MSVEPGVALNLNDRALKAANNVKVLPDDTDAIQRTVQSGVASASERRVVQFPALSTLSNPNSQGYNLGGDVVLKDNLTLLGVGNHGIDSKIRRTGGVFSPETPKRRYFKYTSRSPGVAQLSTPVAPVIDPVENVTLDKIYVDGNADELTLGTDESKYTDYTFLVRADALPAEEAAGYAENIKIVRSEFVDQPGPCAAMRTVDKFYYEDARCTNPRKGGLLASYGSNEGYFTNVRANSTNDDAIALSAAEGGAGQGGATGGEPAPPYANYVHDVTITNAVASIEGGIDGGAALAIRGGRNIDVRSDPDLPNYPTTLRGGSRGAIAVLDSSDRDEEFTSSDIDVQGGDYSNVGQPGAAAITIDAREASGIRISDATIHDAPYGVWVRSQGPLDDLTFSGNTMDSLTRGFYVTQFDEDDPDVEKIDQLTIDDNTITDTARQAFLSAEAAVKDTLTFTDNTVVDANNDGVAGVDALSSLGRIPVRLQANNNEFRDTGGPRARHAMKVDRAADGGALCNIAPAASFTATPTIVVPSTVSTTPSGGCP
ncbi:MAG: right-handed parallel beta-helix repeat-containing protein [Rubrobacter sp.]